MEPVPLMHPRPRDGAAPVLALVLALLALPATGLAQAAWLPLRPAAYAALALGVCALAFLAWGTRRPGLRPLLLLLAAAPALVFGLLGSGAGRPSAGWWVLLVVCGLLAWLRPRRGAAIGVLTGSLGVALLLGSADAGHLPGEADPLRASSAGAAAEQGAAGTSTHPDAGRRGLRRGTAVAPGLGARPAFGEGPGPWFVEAATATSPGPRPVILVVPSGHAAGAGLPGASVPGASVPGGGAAQGRGTVVSGEAVEIEAPFALRGVDVVVALERAWRADDAQAGRKARAIAAFVRRGGLLIGPAPGRPWPARLAPLLRVAGRSPVAGADGARRLGMGWVARAAHQRDVGSVLAADLWVREVGTSLLDPAARPAPLSSWAAWRDRPGERRSQGILLLLHALALAVFTRILRGGAPQVLGAFLVAAGVLAGLVWTVPQDPGFRVEGAAVDLGGRRVDAVWISAGPRGYTGHVRFRGGGVVGHRGGRLLEDGRLRIEAGRSAWIVREAPGTGSLPGEVEDRGQAAVLELLRGGVDPRRLRLGRTPALPVRVEGWGAVPAASVVIRPPRR